MGCVLRGHICGGNRSVRLPWASYWHGRFPRAPSGLGQAVATPSSVVAFEGVPLPARRSQRRTRPLPRRCRLQGPPTTQLRAAEEMPAFFATCSSRNGDRDRFKRASASTSRSTKAISKSPPARSGLGQAVTGACQGGGERHERGGCCLQECLGHGLLPRAHYDAKPSPGIRHPPGRSESERHRPGPRTASALTLGDGRSWTV
jgi:hypothetical protein